MHRELGEAGPLHKDVPTVNDARCWNRDVIFPLAKPFKAQGGIAVLRGNLAPQGAILKPSAASEPLMRHRGKPAGEPEALVAGFVAAQHSRADAAFALQGFPRPLHQPGQRIGVRGRNGVEADAARVRGVDGDHPALSG